MVILRAHKYLHKLSEFHGPAMGIGVVSNCWVPESVGCSAMVFNKKRAAERAQREEAKLLCAIALVGLLSPALAAEVSAGVAAGGCGSIPQ